MTKRYTTPYPAFRQVFALRASEGAATVGRIEVLVVLVNSTAVLGETHDLITVFAVCFRARSTGIHVREQGQNDTVGAVISRDFRAKIYGSRTYFLR